MKLPVHRLESGTVLLSDGFLPSDEGYTHRIDTVHDIGGGWTRVFIDVLNVDGVQRTRYDKLYGDDYEEVDVALDVAMIPPYGHGCTLEQRTGGPQ